MEIVCSKNTNQPNRYFFRILVGPKMNGGGNVPKKTLICIPMGGRVRFWRATGDTHKSF